MINIPYGLSNFATIAKENYHYIDRTPYLELLESLGERYLFLVRPRRFGKSLFISMLHYYYGQEHKVDFDTLFGKYHIGQHPTPLANTYLILQISFVGIGTHSATSTFDGFLRKVKVGVYNFLAAYPDFFEEKDRLRFKNLTMPSAVMDELLVLLSQKARGQKLYILIDEYDHFANELLAFDFSNFKKIVSRNGYVRKFYETLKEGTLEGIIDRMFITGVTPITMDSMTSGFNIASKITTDPRFNGMLGFRKSEVLDILRGLDMGENQAQSVMQNLKRWYNGYLFSQKAKEQVYNSGMVLYFAKEYLVSMTYPDNLLDTNIASDYYKVRKLFSINNKEIENKTYLKELIVEGQSTARLTQEYSFEKEWSKDDFISLLFYQGMVTIKGERLGLGRLIFSPPNYVIQQLYYQYFQQLTLEEANIRPNGIHLADKIEAMAVENEVQPLIDLTQQVLSKFSVEDHAHYNEMTIKAIFTSFFHTTQFYHIYSELKIQKSKTETGRLDLLLLARPPFKPTYQFVFELKYLKKKHKATIERTKKAAIAQLQTYLENEEILQNQENLKAYVVIFVANEGILIPVEKN